MMLSAEQSRATSIPKEESPECGIGSRRTPHGDVDRTVTTPSLGGGRTGILCSRDPGERLLDPSCELEVQGMSFV